jgi:hypothetical protein
MLRLLVQHCLVAMFPPTDDFPGIATMDLPQYVTRFLSDASWLLWLGTVGSSLLFVATPIVTIYVPLPSFLLTRTALDRHAQNAADSNIYLLRNASFLVKMIGGLHWAGTPAIRSTFHMAPYPPDPQNWRTE